MGLNEGMEGETKKPPPPPSLVRLLGGHGQEEKRDNPDPHFQEERKDEEVDNVADNDDDDPLEKVRISPPKTYPRMLVTNREIVFSPLSVFRILFRRGYKPYAFARVGFFRARHV